MRGLPTRNFLYLSALAILGLQVPATSLHPPFPAAEKQHLLQLH
jgi:hypothetical protein